ncbi:DUF2510 domain-containing protein [Schumannella sp. 10F1B-5-1]|uniref:DUF2510 domain-containing protein n=1 Tax=Schumannella sp. 10F1B-5-1 TaxID=2590780 RepID=UPI00112FF88C|nr:DUF2510 domain-containing protein [Schumannella sp. 10F1B-5-1]TPW70769.1 DUF2510 domain-containing protein [Schumannella sp. 10F1B-5-1]
MTDIASARPRAGWYDDPTDATGLRWWDGVIWTDNAMPKPSGAPVAVAPPLGSAYSVDDGRPAASSRRAARQAAREAARTADPSGVEAPAEPLARVTPLHPAPADAAPTVASTPDPAPGDAGAGHGEPQAVVPPSAAPVAAPPTSRAQLGPVPDAVFAPGPVDVAVAPPALPSFADFLASAEAAAERAAPDYSRIPQPGELVADPTPGTAVLDPAATTTGPSGGAAPVAEARAAVPKRAVGAVAAPMTAPAPVVEAAPAPAAAPVVSPETAPVVPSTASPITVSEPAVAPPARREVAAIAPRQPAAVAVAPAAPAAAPAPDAAPAAPAAPAFNPDFAPDGSPLPAPASALPPLPMPVPLPSAPSVGPSRPANDWWRGLMPTGSVTTSAVLLALAPVAATVVPIGALGFAVELPDLAVALLALPVLLVVAPIVFAAVDRSRLRGMGWAEQASAAWAVLGPFWYLIARQHTLRKQGARTLPFTVTTLLMPLVSVGTTAALLWFFQHDILVWALTLQVRLA